MRNATLNTQCISVNQVWSKQNSHILIKNMTNNNIAALV